MDKKQLKMATTFGEVQVELEADKITPPGSEKNSGYTARGNVVVTFTHKNRKLTLYLPVLFIKQFSTTRPRHGEERYHAQYVDPMFSIRDGRGSALDYKMFNAGGHFMPNDARLKELWGKRPS
jgi:hypothetical protein